MARKYAIFIALIILILVTSCGRLELQPGATTATTTSEIGLSSLRTLAQNRDILLGPAVSIEPFREDATYISVLAHEFNLLMPENELKFASLHPERDTYNFTKPDAMVAFAKANDMQVRGHTLLYHLSMPRWLSEGHFTRNELMDILREHVYTVVGHYRGQIRTWDVVNEALDADSYVKDSLWQRVIGPEYIDWVFRWAHEADPQARLYYNDYGAERKGQKADTLYNFVKGMVERGVPIHGVGLQLHIGVTGDPKPSELAKNIERFAALGLDVDITELDVLTRVFPGTKQEKLKAQARFYGDVLRVCLKAKNCKAYVLWGFTDRYTWIKTILGYQDEPLILDESYRPKPAYYEIKKVLNSEF